ncbi:MAG: B12-binding domain-containing radical SAM protein [Deltaproteobacteria bacterium]|nr:MAG: B12-binding domain-containing radical SAM protein [Deltaproteobacteria bacterium]
MKRVLLIYPRPKDISMSSDTPYPFPMLGLTLLASLFPPEYEVIIVNELLQEIDFNEDVDLVGITTLTSLAKRAYEVADRFRERGIKVVLGGVHATFMPHEAMNHADSVVLGEAEEIMPRLIGDLERGELQSSYRAERVHDLEGLPMPRRDLLGKGYSPIFKVIETTRGCPNRCEFCAVPVIAGRRYRTRPLSDIERELRIIVERGGEYIFIVDDNVIGQKAHAKGLFELLKGFKVRWMGFATIEIAKDEELLRGAQESGCVSLFIGFESLNRENLEGPKRKFRGVKDLQGLVERIHDHGIGTQGSFVFGFDQDDPGVFERTVEFIHKTRIELPNYSVLTPFPGTPLWERLNREGRIFDGDWSHYDMSRVVFLPKMMTPEQLQQGYLWAQKYSCAPRSILKRLLLGPRHHLGYFLLSNFVLRKAQMKVIKRLKGIPLPVSSS